MGFVKPSGRLTGRYWVQMHTAWTKGSVHVTGWVVRDMSMFDKNIVAEYPTSEEANMMCNFLNKQVDIERANNVRGT